MKHGFGALLGLALLAGCASLSEEECLTGAWASIGQRDGAAGQVADVQFLRHVAACEKAGVSPVRAAWQTGYDLGLQSYCTPAKGLTEGLAGRSYRQVCPAGAEPMFLRGFRVGTDDYEARQDVTRLHNEISRLQSRSTEIIAALAAQDTPALRLELQNNQATLLRLQLELGFARAEAARTRRAVADFREG